MTPMMVRLAPVDWWKSKSCSTRNCLTRRSCSSLAFFLMTISMCSTFRAQALQAAGLVNHPFEQADDGFVFQRSGILPGHGFENGLLALRIVDRNAVLFLDFADFQRQVGPLVENAQQFAIQAVDFPAKVVDGQKQLPG